MELLRCKLSVDKFIFLFISYLIPRDDLGNLGWIITGGPILNTNLKIFNDGKMAVNIMRNDSSFIWGEGGGGWGVSKILFPPSLVVT